MIRAWTKSSIGLRLSTQVGRPFLDPSIQDPSSHRGRERRGGISDRKKTRFERRKSVLRKRGAGRLSLECGDGEKSHEEVEEKTRRAEWGLKEEASLIGAAGGIKERRARNAAG